MPRGRVAVPRFRGHSMRWLFGQGQAGGPPRWTIQLPPLLQEPLACKWPQVSAVATQVGSQTGAGQFRAWDVPSLNVLAVLKT